jgi:hypothetical protein
MRRRTYRAHGRINGKITLFALLIEYILNNLFLYMMIAYLSCPAHINLIAEEASDEVTKEDDKAPATLKLSKKQIAQGRGKGIAVGGGV